MCSKGRAMSKLIQTPDVGEHKLLFCGDIINFKIVLGIPRKGKAFLRTNLGKGFVLRREVVARTLENRVGSAQDWHDIPMVQLTHTEYAIDIALTEVGHFEAMCCFFEEGSSEPIWPGSENVSINVEPAEFSCANSIYCAFPRQFGPNKYNKVSKPVAGLTNAKMQQLDDHGYTIIPPSGKFRDVIKELDHIINTLNCRIIHLLPINPTPTVYAKMGRYGSPYASLDFTNIDPALAEFDRKATPLEQFLELVDEIHHRNAKLIIDVAINHTGWAAKVHEIHPEWLIREPDGEVVSPGAWGVIWEDLTELDHANIELREYLAEMFLTWCERGVDGFRCDAGYMIPFAVWEYIIATVKQQYPDTIFLLEGLGGDPNITLNLLNKANMNWAYSELFQNYSKQDITRYISFAQKISSEDGLMVNYAETHDNNRMAAVSKEYCKMRTGLCALLSSSGAFGFTNGVEWFATEKIDVHEARALNWGCSDNQVEYIARINTILMENRAFHRESRMKFIEINNDNILAVERVCRFGCSSVLIIINLDCDSNQSFVFSKLDLSGFVELPVFDLITDSDFSDLFRNNRSFSLTPGQILCLSAERMKCEKDNHEKKSVRPDIIDRQRAGSLALELMCWKNKSSVVFNMDTEVLTERLLDDPITFFQNLYHNNTPVPLVYFYWPTDTRREVMVPPNHVLLIVAPHRFKTCLKFNGKIEAQHYSLCCKKGNFFTFLTYSEKAHIFGKAQIEMSVYTDEKCERTSSEILLLRDDFTAPNHKLEAKDIRKTARTFLDTNDRGGMLRPCIEWGKLIDRYNAILAANTDTEIPVDRHIMFNRMRAWMIRQGRSEEFNISTTDSFFINTENGGTWNFHIPVGNGLYVDCSIAMVMIKNKNAVKLSVYRHAANGREYYLRDDEVVDIILRPDIEDRSFHSDTKADHALKYKYENAVISFDKGFRFAPNGDNTLRMISSKGKFKVESEWKYNIPREVEEERGFDKYSDLFSPGYFKLNICGGEHTEIVAQVLTEQESAEIEPNEYVDYKYLFKPSHNNLEKVLLNAMDKYIVKRNELKTVIAGYPWFLDWGRDTLICARGLISAGKFDDVKEILLQFAKFSKDGMLPNIIHGDTVGNWDTSDAPLWLIIATQDYCKAADDFSILQEKPDGKRTMLEALMSIADNYMSGTPNGIKMDKGSKLIYSPSHFTWMDTNYPAGTPREGYPIEIQAMWYASLSFIGELSNNKKYDELAAEVKESIKEFFVYEETNPKSCRKGKQWLSDCLHAKAGMSAREAEADDHIRPNQLFAITLGAVDDFELCQSIIEISSVLLIPGGIRSCADKVNNFKLPVYGNDGYTLLNNPDNPYWGRYQGDEDTCRKAAYHNGTAWTWPFPQYSEAYLKTYGKLGVEHALSILSSSEILFNDNSFYQIPEILDGDLPHKQRGCDAQAWGVTELYRVWKLLKE